MRKTFVPTKLCGSFQQTQAVINRLNLTKTWAPLDAGIDNYESPFNVDKFFNIFLINENNQFKNNLKVVINDTYEILCKKTLYL